MADPTAQRPGSSAGLRPLEVAGGALCGPGPAATGEEGPPGAPVEAFEAVLLEALERPPCLVTFSGGRDSSALLAVAVAVARRTGLPDPVPATFRFPDVAMADENRWQDLVVAHLGVADWYRRDVTDELDIVGPVSRSVLRRHGLLHPTNAFLHVPLFAEARGGSVVTGIGGDHVFATWGRQPLADLRAGRSLHPAAVLEALRALPPARLRPVVERATTLGYWAPPWLHTPHRRADAANRAAEAAAAPLTYERWLPWRMARRDLTLALESYGRLAADAGVALHHPFTAPGVVRALARAGGRDGFGSRTAAMRRIFADHLPDAVLARRSKGRFHGVFWRAAARAAVSSWDGSGIDPAMVDVDILRATWKERRPDFRSAMLLQSVVLQTDLRDGAEAAGATR